MSVISVEGYDYAGVKVFKKKKLIKFGQAWNMLEMV